MEDKKYLCLFDIKKYLFLDNISINKSNCVILIVSNGINIYSDKLLIIDQIFRIFQNFMCQIIVVIIFPTMSVTTILSIKDLMIFLSNLNVAYKKYSEEDNDKILDCDINIILINLINKLKFVNDVKNLMLINMASHIFKCEQNVKQLVKYVSSNDNLFESLKKQDFDVFSKIYVDLAEINENIKHIADIEILVYKLFEICVYTKNNKNIHNKNTIIDIYDKFFIFFKKYDSSKFTMIINILNEWIRCLMLTTLNLGLELIRYDKQISFSNISVKNTNKIIKSTDLTDIKKLENQLSHVCTNLTNQLNQLNQLNQISQLSKLDNPFYFSKYSQSGWKEEIEEKNCLCLIMCVSLADYNKTGKIFNDVLFTNLTKSFISALDFINLMGLETTTQNLNSDINNTDNTALPVYINKFHWTIAKHYIPLMLSMAIVGNINMYNQKFSNIYYLVMNEYFKFFIESDNSDELICRFKLWTCVFRTCIELSKEKHYHKGINKYCNDIIKNINLNKLNSSDVNYPMILAQLTSCGIDNIINISNMVDNKFKDFGELIKNNILLIPAVKSKYKHLLIQSLLVSEFKKKVGGFKNLIKLIDQNGGLFPKIYEVFAINYVNANIGNFIV